MNQKFSISKLSIKFLNFLTLISLCYLSLTGFRMMLFDSRIVLPVWLEWLSILEFGRNIQLVHFSAGMLFASLLVLKIGFEFFFVKKIKTKDPSSITIQNRLNSISLAVKLLLFAAIISGLTISSELISSSLIRTILINIHSLSFWAVIAVSLAYLFFRLSIRSKNDNLRSSIVISSRKAWISFIVVMVIAMFTIMVIPEFIKPQASLSSRRMRRSVNLDGIRNRAEWQGADSVIVPVIGGDNFENSSTNVLVKSFRDRRNIYFLFQWRDKSRSYNRQLIKTNNGWIEQKSDSSIFGESLFFEDQLAVSFGKDSSGCLKSCHVGTKKKAGQHYTSGDTSDVWVWRALHTNPVGEADDGWWDGNTSDSTRGIRFDNSAGGGYALNLNLEWDEPYFLSYHPGYRYWIDVRSKYFMPYRPGLDLFTIGAIQPAIVTAPFTGDRGDIRARGNWANGLWTVELSRTINTGSPFDIPLLGRVWMGIAPFDNSEKKHSYHFRAIELLIEK